MSLSEAFFDVCNEAQPAKRNYVSLYIRCPYYGGPEEGGWWGEDVFLVAYQDFPSREQAEVAWRRIEGLAEVLNEESRRSYGEHCLRQMEWLDARGLDSDFLPEVDGEEIYFVTIEDEPGTCEARGCRHYE